jgi:hypothetical protein
VYPLVKNVQHRLHEVFFPAFKKWKYNSTAALVEIAMIPNMNALFIQGREITHIAPIPITK